MKKAPAIRRIRFAKPTQKTVWALAVLAFWCVFIFSMSARVADDSDALSLGVAGYLLNLFVPDFGTMSAAEQLALAESINYPLRKLAHFSEYAVLGVLAFAAARMHVVRAGDSEGSVANRAAIPLLSWAFCVLYAASDEIHQIFVPGRACLFTDVCIDSAGALLGVALLAAVFAVARAVKRRKAER